MNKPSSDSPPMIEVRNLVKNFGEFRAVDSLSFSVPAGSIFGFLGPNGAGKTTTIKMLTTMLRPSGGSIRIGGHDVVSDQALARNHFGIVFQDPSLDDELTAFENMELHGVIYRVPAAERKEQIGTLLRFVDLWDRKDGLVKHFSGGMKRRLEVARALLHRPKILFLDEPTLGLDPQTRNHIWAYIKEMNQTQGMTVFFTTHHLEEADRVAEQIAVIDQGKIVALDSPSKLKESTGKDSLEDAFIALTGHTVREGDSSSTDRMRLVRKLWDKP